MPADPTEWPCPICGSLYDEQGDRTLTHSVHCGCPEMPRLRRLRRSIKVIRRCLAAMAWGEDSKQAFEALESLALFEDPGKAAHAAFLMCAPAELDPLPYDDLDSEGRAYWTEFGLALLTISDLQGR